MINSKHSKCCVRSRSGLGGRADASVGFDECCRRAGMPEGGEDALPTFQARDTFTQESGAVQVTQTRIIAEDYFRRSSHTHDDTACMVYGCMVHVPRRPRALYGIRKVTTRGIAGGPTSWYGDPTRKVSRRKLHASLTITSYPPNYVRKKTKRRRRKWSMERSIWAPAFLNDLKAPPKSNLVHHGASRRLTSWSFTSAVGREATHVDMAKMPRFPQAHIYPTQIFSRHLQALDYQLLPE